MIKDFEVLNELKSIRQKTGYLKNIIKDRYSYFWSDIDSRLKQIEKDIETKFKNI